MRGHLIQIDAVTTLGVSNPLRVASVPDSALCHLDGFTWQANIARLPQLRYDFFGGTFQGQISAPQAQFTVSLDGIAAGRLYANARVRIWTGEIGTAFAAFTLRFDGRISAEPEIRGGMASFNAAPDDAWLDTPLLGTFAGTGGIEGPDDLTGTVKPLALGNVEWGYGELIDPVNLVYMVNNGAVQAVNAVFDRGQALGTSTGNFASLATLIAATIPPGRWATCHALGLVRLGAPSDGKIAFHVSGDNRGSVYARTPGALIGRVVAIAGGTANSANLTALDAARPYNLQIEVLSQTTARQLIQSIADSVGAVAGISWLGQLFVQPLAINASPSVTLNTDGSSALPVASVTASAMGAPFWRLATEAERTWVVYDQGEIATGYVIRGAYDAAKTYRIDDLVTVTDGSSWAYINSTPSAGNAPPPDPSTGNAYWLQVGPRIEGTPGPSQATVTLYQRTGRAVLPAVTPAAGWNGTLNSGITSPPTDPTRTTAKPVLCMLVPPNQYFTDRLVVGFFAAANESGSLANTLGVSRLDVYFENNTPVAITAPSLYTFDDANGVSRSYFAWWCELVKPAGVEGHGNLYAKATPRDATMQARVMGPYQFSPQAAQYDIELTVAPSQSVIAGSRYQTITAAVAYAKAQGKNNPKITITEAITDGAWFWNSGAMTTQEGYYHLFATAPVLIKPNQLYPLTQHYARPNLDGIWFHGSNFTFDYYFGAKFDHEGGARNHVFEGVKFTDSGGRYYLVLKGQKPATAVADGPAWYLECEATYVQNGMGNANLNRGCLLDGGSGDAVSASQAVIGCTIRNWTGKEFRSPVNAMTVQYVGAGASATIEMSQGNESSNPRILNAKVAGVSVGTFTVTNTTAAAAANTNYTVANVVAWLNTLSGWTATVLDDTRRATALCRSPSISASIPATACKAAPLTLETAFDQHVDMWGLDPSSGDNVTFAFNNCYNNNAQNLFISPPTGGRDIMVLNNAFDQDETDPGFGGNSISQLVYSHSHVVIAHNSWSNQTLTLATAATTQKLLVGSYCLLANNVCPAIAWNGTPDTDLVIKDNHLFTGGTNPSGATGTTIVGTKATLFTNPSVGNFTPLGALLTDLKTPVLTPDTKNASRAATDAAGALSIAGVVGSSDGPPLPSADVTYTFATGAASGLTNGWGTVIPSATVGGDPYWAIQAVAMGEGTTDVITPSEWSAPTIPALDGQDGDSGADAIVPETTGPTSYAVPCLSNLTPKAGALDGAAGTMRLRDSTTGIITSGVSGFAVVSSTNCTASINATTGFYTFSVISAMTATGIFKCVYAGLDYYLAVSLSKVADGQSAAQITDTAAVSAMSSTSYPAADAEQVDIDVTIPGSAILSISAVFNYVAVAVVNTTTNFTGKIKVTYQNITDAGAETDLTNATGGSASTQSTTTGPGDITILETPSSASIATTFTNPSGTPKIYRIRLYAAKSAGSSTGNGNLTLQGTL